MRLFVRTLVVVVVMLALGAPGALAQPLADRVPSDALLYVGWAGSEKLAPAYSQSHLKGVLDASNLPQLFAELGPKIVRRIQLEQMLEGDAVAREVLPGLLALGEAAWNKPVAVYVGPLDYSGKIPMPKVAILCEAGKDAKGLVETVEKMIAQIPADAPVKIRARVGAGDVLIVSNFEFPDRIEETLGQREQFKEAMKHGRPEPALVAYFDAEKVLNVASLAINMGGNAKMTQQWQRILLTTGVAGIKRLVYTAGFDGKDWGSQAFIEAPQPRMGLLMTVLDGEPIGDDLFNLVPQSSNWVSAARVDLGKIVGGVRGALGRMNPDLGRESERVFADLNAGLGFDLQKDFLTALGDQWVAFNSDQTGHGILGLALVSPLRDAGKVEKALTVLEQKANAAMKQDADQEGPTFSIETAKVGELTVHYLAIPALAPCWAIKDGRLYVALFPQILAAAAETDSGGKSVLGNEDFLAARKRLGVEKTATSLSYMNLPKLAPRGYQMVLAAQRTGLGMADMFGLQTPALAVPPLNKIMPHLSSSVGATWVDDAGWHYRGVSPFPAADLLGGEQALIATAAPVALAVALPAYAKARSQAVAVASMSNLRQIGVASQMYANDNNGDFPPDLGSMLKYLGDSPQVFVTPERQEMMMLPANAKPEERAKWVNENSDYTYLGKGVKIAKLPINSAEYVIAHEKFTLAKNGLVSAVYADGHAAMLPVPLVEQAIAAQKLAMEQRPTK